ncbi:MAG: carboxypeptidase regulatory-like domain-containing protein [Bacteroidales bacterium]|nr:carboxypeptidase regulatory-like domain-containing protein [Bacteroidales bacterium]
MKRIVLTLVLLLLSCMAMAQRLQVAAQDNIRLPWGVKNLTMVDGRLYGCSNGVMVAAAIEGTDLYALQPDTLPHFLGESLEYVVRNPRDGHLYFSHKDERSGKYTLMEHVKNRGRKNTAIELRAWRKGIFHPTFSPDGNVMVFTSSGKVGLGGYDLWCSFWNGKRWSRPVNLGNVINGPGNEICPVFYNDYLIFASDSVPNSTSGYNFYSVRFRKGTTLDDVLFGTYQVQRLPYPLNADSNDIELAVDAQLQRGYWITNRAGHEEIYSFSGSLMGVMLTGVVSDIQGSPVPEAEVRVFNDDRVVSSTSTDANGRYRLLVQPGQNYLLQVKKHSFYANHTAIAAIRANDDLLVAYDTHNVTLRHFPFNVRLSLRDVYRGAEVEISDDGKRIIMPAIEFVRDNPKLMLTIEICCDQTADAMFNNMVIEHRISDLKRYLYSVLPSNTQILIKNGNAEGQNQALASGENHFFITFSE